MRPFQIIIFGIFAALAIGGLVFFAAFRGFNTAQDAFTGGITIWGTFDAGPMQEVLGSLASDDDRWSSVTYIRKDPRAFENEFVNAVAEGRGPDLVILPSDLLASEYGKLIPIPYDQIPVRDFKDGYVDGAEVFMFPNGIYGIPIAIDPLVMYWNRSLFASRGLASPPRTWEEMVSVTAPAILSRTNDLTILQSPVAFGGYTNVMNAKGILLMLLMQAGSNLVTVGTEGFVSDLNGTATKVPTPPGDAALRFYTEFSDPAKSTYSWNRSLPQDRDMFVAGDLGMYFGFGSEARALYAANPNLDFDVAEVPQGAGANIRKGYGTIYALAIPRTAQSADNSYSIAQMLGNASVAKTVSDRLGLAPVHRSVISGGTGDPIGSILYRAALIAKGWLDPNPSQSDNIFKQMVEDTTSGRSKVGSAVQDASSRLQYAF